MQEVCSWFSHSKSGFYKHLKVAEKRQKEEEMTLYYLREIRRSGIMCGARKMQVYLEKFFAFKIGRDRLFEIMHKYNFQCRYYKQGTVTSTGRKSNFANLLEDLQVDYFGQVIASDITYIHLPGNRFCYATVISDLYTRMILGHYVSENLMLEGSLKALKMAFRKYQLPPGAIHHSDHGVQYTSKEYTSYLNSKGISISMTGRGKCYDNAQAERIFNTLKHEYGFKMTFNNIKEVRSELNIFVNNYNNVRIHESLGYKTPREVYEISKKAA
jgi:transposase InsO family protein